MADFQTIKLEIADGIATLTLNRPDKLNSFTARMLYELVDAFDETDANDDVKAVIVTGAGRAFCAGADLSAGGDSFKFGADHEGRDPRDVHPSDRDGGGIVTLRMFRSLKPIIGAINGPAVGVGATLTLAMDVRLASETAKMGFVFARRGIVPESCSSFYLPRLVGLQTAMEWCLTGRVFSAQEAKERGLVRSLYAPDALLAAAYELAREIADNTAPVSVALTRRMLLDMLVAEHPMEAHRLESWLIIDRGKANDVKEGVASFLEKRAPNYPDRVSRDMPRGFPWEAEPPFKA